MSETKGPSAPRAETEDERPPTLVRLADYTPPAFLVDTVDLRFELAEEQAVVHSELALRRNPRHPASPAPAPLVLDGQDLELLSVHLDGERLEPDRLRAGPDSLTIEGVPERFRLRVVTRIQPQRNTALEGLYRSGGMFCTQCEAEGFRRITYYLDRPDVMARFTTTIVAERERYPVLLSNGNAVAAGDAGAGLHTATWEDPHPKPSYLFALVAGDLACIEDTFVTASGRRVRLQIYVEPHNRTRCDHAMESLKRAMRWDEEVFGLEYDLDVYMIVAVDDFNMGAMENKGLNVFNSKYVLADPQSATDADYENIEAVIAHEYFHNWTGNRVTCRDWFQLSLKEGLTVFRDQAFTADLRSRAVKRIGDVRLLRTAQFKEDAGPMAHPVRPDAYMEINNFYTVTVYNKGAELVRMIHRILGPARFRAGMDLYFERHDGEAVTTDDFVAAMQDASGVDLAQFKRWYGQAGTPRIEVSEVYDPASGDYALTLRQSWPPTPDGKPKAALHIPVAIGLIAPDGRPLPLGDPDGEDMEDAGHTRVVHLREREQTLRLSGLEARPVSSVLRGFTAPVRLEHPRPARELAFLLRHDPDPFNRWDAGQQYAERELLRFVGAVQAGAKLAACSLDTELVDALRAVLADAADEASDLDRALVAQILTLPAESYLADQLPVIDVEAVHAARRHARGELARALHAELEALYARLATNAPYRFDTSSAARRSLRNVCLGYLMDLEEPAAQASMRQRCLTQLRDADNMTDVVAALALLCDAEGDERDAALDEFEQRWRRDPLVLDKWFALQAGSRLPGTLDEVVRLSQHPAYDRLNPNRVRALVGTFCHQNQVRFHAADGSGYRFLAEQVLQLDRLNPQIAARLASAFSRWRSFDPDRREGMRHEMERILAAERLSPDTFEIVTRSLSSPPAPA